MHPLRWLAGGPLFGDDEPEGCAICGTWIPPDCADCWCDPCRAKMKAERDQREREEAERGIGADDPDPVHRDGRP